jgi:PAS domain S-box-containing protein
VQQSPDVTGELRALRTGSNLIKKDMGRERTGVLLLQYRRDETSVPSGLLEKLAADCLIDTERTLSDGLERLRQRRFDAVLLDLVFVNDEGLDALAELVTQEPTLPVVVLGEIDNEELVARAMRLGAEDYVSPATVDGRSLARVVRCAIERKRSETAFRERGEKHRALLNALPDMIFRLDPDGKFLDFVPSQDAFPFVSPNAFLGKKIRDVLPPDAAELAMHFLKRTLELGEKQSFEYHLTVNDSTRYYEARQVPSGDGEVLGFVRDVTESKLAAQALRESEARFRAIFDGAAVGIALVDTDGRPRETNSSLRRMLGYERDELRDMVFTEFTHPDDSAEDMGLFKELVTGKRDRYEMDKRYIRKDGRVVWTHLNVSLVRGAGDVAPHVIAMVEDITERKTGSDALRASEEQLRQAQRVEAVGRLAGGVAHDFNNLLTAMLGYTEFVLDELGPTSPLRADLLDVKKNGQRAAELTRQLLAFSRRQVLQPEVLDLNHVVAGISKMLRRLISEDIELVTVPDPALGNVKADPGQIEQVIMNLVVNSRDAMPEGGKLTISTENVHLDATHSSMGKFVKPGSYILLRVSDTGSGMDEETQSRIFEPFFTTKEKGKGTGLGLSTVFGIVKQSGGYVWVESKLGVGTTFDVYLPRVDEAVTTKPRTGSFLRPSSLRNDQTILVVEDEASVRTLTRRILENSGCRVLEARNGGEGLNVSERHPGPIDLVISDVVMPELNGPDMIARIAANRPQAKFLYMSGYTEEAVLRTLDPEIPFLDKPFTAKELVRKVREALNPELEGE